LIGSFVSATPAPASVATGAEAAPMGAGGSRKMRSRSRNFAMVTPEMAAQVVAMIEVPTIALGLAE
jgi:hypothetical protein